MMAMPLWLKKKLWIPNLIRKEPDYSGKILFSEHYELLKIGMYPSFPFILSEGRNHTALSLMRSWPAVAY